jgi:hypothetical protein
MLLLGQFDDRLLRPVLSLLRLALYIPPWQEAIHFRQLE